MRIRRSILVVVAFSLAGTGLAAAGPAGWPSRDPDLDVLPGFVSPPPGYGEVAFYWWLGDPLTKERIGWQLDRLAEAGGVSGLQVNYAHTDSGGRSYGLTFPSDPPLLSEAWWDLFRWFVGECKRRGIAASLSDYTLAPPGQGWWTDEIIREDPDIAGSLLQAEIRDAGGGADPDGPVDRLAKGEGPSIRWRAPDGAWKIVSVSARRVPLSIDPMNPKSGPKVVETFFQRFEDRLPGEGGKGLNFFFSDELDLGIGGRLWNDRFPAEFRRRKGYDILPELPALFVDIGPRTPKVRLDYSDVVVALSEEGFFRPLFEWHAARGMTYGCDHGGRGRNVTEFGDYFRTQRWMTGPGNDSPGLSADIVKNKVASSIAHLYERPRTWLEGYHSSGWGTSTAQLVDATLRNFVMGHNLLGLHGLYYTTHGGFWEWAPPCNHFRMPYWAHMGVFLRWSERLSYLLAQGRHVCDVAIIYPVAPVEAGMDGDASVRAAFGLGEHLYKRGIDFDYMDFESLARARIDGVRIRVAGESYRVLVLPSMRAVRHSTIEKALEFRRAGGMVIGFGALPEASDRAGRDDPVLDAMVGEIFGGGGLVARKAEEVEEAISKAFPRDFAVASAPAGSPYPWVLHRRIGPRDVYLVWNAARGSECFFRAKGDVELWDPWTGRTRRLRAVAETADGTRIRMPLEACEGQIIVFGSARPASEGAGAEAPEPRAGGEAPPPLALDGAWEFDLAPTMDNRWGDFRWPPSEGCIGAEARRFRHAQEAAADPGWETPGLDDARWEEVTCAFGPRFWKLGPLPDGADTSALEARLASLDRLDPGEPVAVDGKTYAWQPYAYSLRWGIEADPGHQGYHGLKEKVSDEFIGLGRLERTATGSRFVREDGGSRTYLWTTVLADSPREARAIAGGLRPAAAWLNRAPIGSPPARVRLSAGANPLLLRYDQPGRGYFVVDAGAADERVDEDRPFSGSASWIWHPDRASPTPAFRRRFDIAEVPKTAALRITCDNGYSAFVNGSEVGRGDDWTRVREIDVTRTLRRGANVIAIAARDDGGEAGLIAELRIDPPVAGDAAIATDATWRCSAREAPGWRGADFDDGAWLAARVIGSFGEAVWATHWMGPPRLEASAPPPISGPLEMGWYRRPSILPYDPRPWDPRPAGWFRFTAPPGLRGMTIAAHGDVRAWADGK
ncbi:MAG: hypothetical protein JXP34_00610, partial [Planctomycetes bacterium]|nr:hypothetical protein [Planctomycetota bacterium]